MSAKLRKWCWLVLLPAIFVARADFFWRFPVTASAALKGLGGSKTYATEIKVNGSGGTLTVFSFNGADVKELSNRMAAKMKLPAPQSDAGSVMLRRETAGRREMVLILPAPDGSDRFSAVAIEGSGKNADTPTWPERVPQVLPGELKFSAVCELTRCAFASTECGEPPAAALEAARERMIAAGWKFAPPGNANIVIFTSGRKQCVISAHADGANGRTVMGLLHREGVN